MKLLHIADLHIGKIVNGYNLLEDQRFILRQILDIIQREEPDGVLLAGDIYDKSIPSAEAVECFDAFFSELEDAETRVFMISGNHDSQERIDYFSTILRKRNIYICGSYRGELMQIPLEDEYGRAVVSLLPFLKPSYVRRYFPEQEIKTYEDAVGTVLAAAHFNEEDRNILVAHQFVAGSNGEAERCDSEIIPVGGLDRVSCSLLAPFDYVALGHLHQEQRAGRETIRYAGSPLKYSFSEIHHKKGILKIVLQEKGSVAIEKIPLVPIREMRQIKGEIRTLLSPEFYELQNRDDYLNVILTDEDYVMDPVGQLRGVYPYIMNVEYDNARTRSYGSNDINQNEEMLSLELTELFERFYEQQNGQRPDSEKEELIQQIFEDIRNGECV